MDVSATAFPSEAVRILQEIASAHFVAFDFEFSGVNGWAPGGKPPLQQYYQEVKAAAERYQVLQVGLTVVKEDLKNGIYVVRPYNFSLSPVPALRERTLSRDWVSSSGGKFPSSYMPITWPDYLSCIFFVEEWIPIRQPH
jgi:poly(A)-specific ribonuclease